MKRPIGERPEAEWQKETHDNPRPKAREQANLSLLRQLAASLEDSKMAIATGNLARIELRTQEQMQLGHELQAQFRYPIVSGVVSPQSVSSAQSASCAAWRWPREAEMAAEFQNLHRRVLQLAREQVALLRRSQVFLTILSHVLAGPSLNYGSVLDREKTFACPATEKRQKEDPCQA